MKANELSCRDLMVGDWVRIKITQHNTTVTNIDANSVYTEAAFPIRYDKIEPILLTPEILEKNGFRKSVSPPGIHAKCYEIEDKDKKYCLTIANYNRYKRLLLNVDSEDSECFNIKCDYVHELQHALKMCEIEKEINL